ncbi:MAG: biotin/lipoyl-binding protein, partial [Ignavibacteria bacterium]|nr:biotin/lipoyl-binding protein [Ignavibacteria bacterium]
MKKKIIVVVAVFAALILIVGKLIINKSAIDEKKQVKVGLATLVNIKEVLKKEQNSSLVLTGVTAAVQEVTLKAEAGGQIVAINFNLGDYVSKGKVLAVIDDKLAKLNLDAAKLNLSKLEDEYNKAKNLYSGNATSETKVRDA